MREQVPEMPIQPEDPILPVVETPVLAKKRLNLNMVLLISGVVLLIGGGVYVLKLFRGPKACSSEAKICADGSAVGRSGPNCEFAPCPPLTSTLTPNETADWKTYTNDEYGFEFKYPNDFIYEVNSQKDYSQITVKNDGTTVFQVKGWKNYPIDQKDNLLDNSSSGEKIIAGIAWKTYSLPNGYCDMGGCTAPIFGLQTEQNNILYSVMFYNQSATNKLSDQFLSTFEFIETGTTADSLEPDGKQLGFIKKVYFQSGQPSVDIDYVEWLGGEEGAKACVEDKKCPADCANYGCLPDGYYIRNNDSKIRTLILDESTMVEMLNEFGGPENEIVDFDTFQKDVSENITKYEGEYYLFWVTIAKGKVVKMIGQYRP